MENTDIIDKSGDGTYSVVSRRHSIPYHEYYKIYNLEVQKRRNNPITVEELVWYQKVSRRCISCVQYLCKRNSSTVRPTTHSDPTRRTLRSPHRVPSAPTVPPALPTKHPQGRVQGVPIRAEMSYESRNG